MTARGDKPYPQRKYGSLGYLYYNDEFFYIVYRKSRRFITNDSRRTSFVNGILCNTTAAAVASSVAFTQFPNSTYNIFIKLFFPKNMVISTLYIIF